MRSTARNARSIALAVASSLLLLPPATAQPVSEVQNVDATTSQVTWDPLAGAVQYRAYRGLASQLPDHCASGVGLTVGTAIDDFETPPLGDAFTYLVSALDSSGEGPLGTATDGTDRLTTISCDLDGDGFDDAVDNCPLDSNASQTDTDGDGTGDACEFSSSGVALRSRMTLRQLPDQQLGGNDIWHYTSQSGNEYAIVGTTTDTAFVNVTDPDNPGLAGFIDGGGITTSWRDMASFGHYAYIVTDGIGVGLQIADMSNIDNDVVTLANTTDLGQGFEEAHNVFVNEASGYLYLCIPNLNGGNGLAIVDLNVSPTNPPVAAFYTDTDNGVRCHDVYVRTYTSGPNAGREIAFCFAESRGLYIVDVTVKTNIFRISKVQYPTREYAHQGWQTDDDKYILLGDELDERDNANVSTTTTYVIDVQDLVNPFVAAWFTNGLDSIDHNLMITNDIAYEANYSSGLRVWDIVDPLNAVEIGHFDTRPENDARNFEGAWGVSSALPSGIVVVNDRQRGLFVLDPSTILSAGTLCAPGAPLNPNANDCAASICDADPYCCSVAWDARCIDAVGSTCAASCEP